MNEKAIQETLDASNGPLFKNNGYFAPLHHREPISKWKSHGRNGRNIDTKKPRD